MQEECLIFTDQGSSRTQEAELVCCCGVTELPGVWGRDGHVFPNSENNEHYHTFIDYLSRFCPDLQTFQKLLIINKLPKRSWGKYLCCVWQFSLSYYFLGCKWCLVFSEEQLEINATCLYEKLQRSWSRTSFHQNGNARVYNPIKGNASIALYWNPW